jgi:hypothetical protein
MLLQLEEEQAKTKPFFNELIEKNGNDLKEQMMNMSGKIEQVR